MDFWERKIDILKLIKNTGETIDEVMKIIEDTKEILRNEGINQWQNGYPNRDTIMNDILCETGYLIINEGSIVGYVSLQYDEDPNYEVIRGRWNFLLPYATIHRFVIAPEYRRRGFALQAMICIEEFCERSVIRVDTSFENIGMRKLLHSLSYQECGIVKVSDGDRLAYDKQITCGKINVT